MKKKKLKKKLEKAYRRVELMQFFYYEEIQMNNNMYDRSRALKEKEIFITMKDDYSVYDDTAECLKRISNGK